LSSGDGVGDIFDRGIGTVCEDLAGGRFEHVQPAIMSRCLQATVDQVGEAQGWHRYKLKAWGTGMHRTRAYAGGSTARL
jgi:hypothetical protein